MVSSTSSTQENTEVLFIYSTNEDKAMGMELLSELNLSIDAINSTSADLEMFDFEKYNSIWIFHSQPMHLTVNISIDWIKQGKGIFVLSDYPQYLNSDFQSLLGIERVYPFHFPLSDNQIGHFNLSSEQSQNLTEINLTIGELEYSGGAALVHMNNQMEPIVTVTIPILNSTPPDLHTVSGIFVKDNLNERIIFGSISSYYPFGNQDASFVIKDNYNKLNSLVSTQIIQQDSFLPEEIINFFTIFGTYIVEGGSPEISGENNFNDGFGLGDLDLSGITPLLGIFALLAGFLAFLLGKGRGILFAIFAGIIGLIAHIAYVPTRRRLTRTEVLKNTTRSNILNFVESSGSQGTHLREIQRKVGCGVSSLLWHLQTLEDFHLIDSMKVGRYTLFFSSDIEFEQDDFSTILRTEMAKKIWMYLLDNKNPQKLASIAKSASCHPETARYHLKKLEDLQIIIKTRDGKHTLYSIPPKRRTQYKNMYIN